MIKKIRSSLTIKICLLMGLLLVAASSLTYAAIAGFLPAFYSGKLEEKLDVVSQEMAETISSHKSIEEAGSAIELFEASSGVSVVILDAEGNTVWPESPEIDAMAGTGDAVTYESAEEIDSVVLSQNEETADEYEKAEAVTASEMPENDSVEEKDFPDTADAAEGIAQIAQDGDSDEENPEIAVEYATESGEDVWDQVISEYLSDAGNTEDYGTLVIENIEGDGGTNRVYFMSQNSAGSLITGDIAEDGSAIQHYELEVGGIPYVMLVLGGMQPVNQATEILHQIFPYILGLILVMALLFALAGSFYLTAPVVRISKISRKMAALDFSDTYQGTRADEIGILGRNLNEMAANLSGTLQNLKLANARLRSDIEMERELEKQRITFFSSVSHELKTPITILKGHLSGMLQGIGAYRDRDYYLGRSLDTTNTMECMVQELLTVSRMESNVFTTGPVDLAELIRGQLAELTELMEEKHLELCLNIPEHLTVEANSGMMEKVIRNLLTNAIRYTPAEQGNEIFVALTEGNEDADISRRTEADAENTPHRIWCSVENTGVHIPEEALPHVFDAFYRVESSRSRRTGGSGLGLYIVRMALEQHSAQYRIENTDRGVRFCFLL